MIHQRSLAPFITPQLGPAQRMNELGICRTFSDMGNGTAASIVAQRKAETDTRKGIFAEESDHLYNKYFWRIWMNFSRRSCQSSAMRRGSSPAAIESSTD